jgi:hypothetical protein
MATLESLYPSSYAPPYSKEKLEAFRQQWNAQISGVRTIRRAIGVATEIPYNTHFDRKEYLTLKIPRDDKGRFVKR